MRTCPFCAAEIEDDARVCRWCQRDLTPAAPAGPPQTSGKAIVSLITGLLFFVLPAAILAVVFGHWSRSEIRASSERLKGAGMALAGLILGYLGVSIVPILIIAAIAIPNLLRAKMVANETSAVGSLRAINLAVLSYSERYGHVPAVLTNLSPSPVGNPSENMADLIDSALGSGVKSGYQFIYQAFDAHDRGIYDAYSVRADPVVAGTTGQRHFFTDQTGIIRVETGRPADEHSPPIR